jgi:hypothetical protein
MGTGRTYNKAPRTRPKKTPSQRRRREKAQRARLVALGVPASSVDAMGAERVRELLKRPAKAVAAVGA